MQESPGADPTAEAASSDRGRRVAAKHGGSLEFEFSRASVVGFL
jgi:hypothetical protein